MSPTEIIVRHVHPKEGDDGKDRILGKRKCLYLASECQPARAIWPEEKWAHNAS